MKKIVSFTLSEKTVEKIDQTSAALGMSRSQLLEYLIEKGWHFPDDITDTVKEITMLRNKALQEIEKEKVK